MYNTMSCVARTIYVEVVFACEYVCLLLLCGLFCVGFFLYFCLSLCLILLTCFGRTCYCAVILMKVCAYVYKDVC